SDAPGYDETTDGALYPFGYGLTYEDAEEPEEPEEPVEPGERTGQFHLSNTWAGTTDLVFPYGRMADDVYVGDWDGDGKDTIAVRQGNAFHISQNLGGDAD